MGIIVGGGVEEGTEKKWNRTRNDYLRFMWLSFDPFCECHNFSKRPMIGEVAGMKENVTGRKLSECLVPIMRV
jgi:hypothetical protein